MLQLDKNSLSFRKGTWPPGKSIMYSIRQIRENLSNASHSGYYYLDVMCHFKVGHSFIFLILLNSNMAFIWSRMGVKTYFLAEFSSRYVVLILYHFDSTIWYCIN